MREQTLKTMFKVLRGLHPKWSDDEIIVLLVGLEGKDVREYDLASAAAS
jgi:hypothetical protein